MEDDDLAQVPRPHRRPETMLTCLPIRRARLAQLKAQAADPSGQASPDLERQHVEQEARQALLAQILEPAAADRLGRIRLVKESRARDVETRLITLARSGQLRSKITEAQLKELLGAVAGSQETETIVVSRRKAGWDDEDDELTAL